MTSFGNMLRVCRRQCHDPLRGGLLTQERLGELLGHELGHAGYSGAAVSDWERDKSKIDEDDRLVLVALVNVLYKHGGVKNPAEANDLLRAGNYRGLDQSEKLRVFPGPPIGEGGESIPALWSHYIPESSERRKQLILLEKVKSFWIEGVLEHSLQDAIPLEIAHRRYDEAVDQPWRDVLGTAVYEEQALQSVGKTLDVFRSVGRALLILGTPGSGKTTTLLTLARDLVAQAEKDPSEPIPVVLSLVSWAEKQGSLAGWLVEELTAKYQIPRRIGRNWLDNAELLLLLDGFDEIPLQQRASCGIAINQFRAEHGLTGIAICSRMEEYESTRIRLKLDGAILLQPLSQVQVDDYLSVAEAQLASLRAAVRQDVALQETVRSPLMLNVMRAAYSHAGRDQWTIDPSSMSGSGELTTGWRQRLFSSYVESMFRRRHADPAFSRRQTTEWLAWLAQ